MSQERKEGSGPPKNVTKITDLSLSGISNHESVCCICNEFVYTSLCFYHANSDIVSQHKYGEMKQICGKYEKGQRFQNAELLFQNAELLHTTKGINTYGTWRQ